MKRLCLLLVAFGLFSTQARAAILPGIADQKWSATFSGGSEFYGTDGSLFSVFDIKTDLIAKGTFPNPSRYTESNAGTEASPHEIPTYATENQQVFAVLYNLQLLAVQRGNTLLSGAALAGYSIQGGDVQFFTGANGQSGTLDVVLSPFAPTANDFVTITTVDPSSASWNGTPSFSVTDADADVLSTANSTLLLQADLQTLGSVGITQVHGVAISGILTGAILAQQVTIEGDVIVNRAFNAVVTGGSEASLIKDGGMAVQDGTFGTPNTGFTTDIRAEVTFQVQSNGASSANWDVYTNNGSFEFVSVPEPTSILVWGGIASVIGIGGVIARRRK